MKKMHYINITRKYTKIFGNKPFLKKNLYITPEELYSFDNVTG